MLKKVIVILLLQLLIVNSSYASLLNSTDQLLNKIPSLGGNAAIKAYSKTANNEIEGGSTFASNFKQNTNALEEFKLGVVDFHGKDLAPKNVNQNQFLQYTYRINNENWFSIAYSKDEENGRSYSLKNDDYLLLGEMKMDVISDIKIEVLALKYGLDCTGFINGLYLGTEVAANIYSETSYVKLNSAAQTALGANSPSDTQVNGSLPYLSYKLDGIFILAPDKTLTFAHKETNARQMVEAGKDIVGQTVDIDYKEEIPGVTSLGYIQKLANNIEVACAMDMVWPKSYIEIGNRFMTGGSNDVLSFVSLPPPANPPTPPLPAPDPTIPGNTTPIKTAGPSEETQVYKLGYTTYTIAGEYKYSPDLLFQGVYSWSPNLGQVNTDKAGIAIPGIDVTAIGINAIKKFGTHSVILGMNNINALQKTSGAMIDSTKYYLNYSLAF